jgi:VWFA-related protein
MGSTHLWDAIVTACDKRLRYEVGRKAIVVISAGEDQGSRYTERDAEMALLESNTNLYAIIASDPSFYQKARTFYNGAPKLRHLTQVTGGRSFDKTKDIYGAFMQLTNELRSQYTLGYRSDRPQRDGSFRQIKIVAAHLKQQVRIRARKGYIAITP